MRHRIKSANTMISVKIEVRGHNNELLAEVERELEYDIVNDKWDKGTYIEVDYPGWMGVAGKDNALHEAIERAENELNQRPELWANDSTPDYHE